ncbi:MAG TPA: GAF domain-containing sensor histidine kinase [Myxococcaceae bacterium]|nr:GAF domain-containing sensor histidine kinase [Myxococcaceae bacterium]
MREIASENQRLLDTLERLFEIPGGGLHVALSHATDLVSSALRSDKVDAFLYEPPSDSLVALGSSNQPVSALQKKLGLDRLPISNGGRVVHVFLTGMTFVTGRLHEDAEELRGVKEGLGLKSKLGIPLEVGGSRRGVLMIASRKADFFTPADVSFAESVARWVAVVAHRAELTEQIARNAMEQGRRAVAEELVTVLAHDIRNYLTPIRARVAMVRRRAERDKRGSDIADADMTLRSLSRLADLVSEILDVSRLDEGVFRMDMQPLDLVQLVAETAGGLDTPEHPIHVKSSEEVIVTADRGRLRQCLENLLSNGVKYSPAGSPVTVLVERRREADGERARVSVLDEGPGLSPELIPRLFERFVTGGDRQGGFGLGLYLAKQIAVLHGGDLVADSPPGAGARFVLTLRCDEESRPSDDDETPQKATGSSHTDGPSA